MPIPFTRTALNLNRRQLYRSLPALIYPIWTFTYARQGRITSAAKRLKQTAGSPCMMSRYGLHHPERISGDSTVFECSPMADSMLGGLPADHTFFMDREVRSWFKRP